MGKGAELPSAVNEIHTKKHAKPAKKSVERHEIESSANGGYILTKHFKHDPGTMESHQPERHVAKNRQELMDLLKSV